MSKISITPNASGTGVFTISSPATNTDRTLTLPDEAGTVLTGSGPINVNASAPNQAVTVDASGNLLVGKTSASGSTQGAELRADGRLLAVSTSDFAGYFNRKSTDGEIVRFVKDTTTVGSIGTVGGKIYIGSPDGSDAYLRFESNQISPCSSVGGVRDNVIDLGKPESRFDDIYATNGTIQTSDRNEKQDIEALSDAEQRVAVACKGLIRKFRWKDAVAEKGDAARIHFGIIAQDLQDAFAAEGLDAGRYAMFISSTWWEADRVVPAVEATDDTEAVAEHTVTDHYDTLEEAPEGATERTRLGVRYPELLAFIIGAL
jgi:hypothetical protein